PSIRTDLRNAGVNVVDQEAARDGNLATSRSPDDLFPVFRRGSTVQPTGAGNRS
ncbi:DJ-1/PfpI family protein, partial [Micrococcus yunnanensis]|uniref:DJ-1/PfpI family protein n=1 Tax=Micrococcus yunnanensis TaxID=566027 RepID=UPI0030152A21